MNRITRTTSAAVVAASIASAAGVVGAQASSHAAANASGLDKEYLKTSIEGDRFEIEGGKLALRISHNAKVLALGKRLIKDHTKSLSDALQLAKAVGAERPSSPSPSEQWELSILGAQTGPTFDRWYTKLEVKDHEQDIDDSKSELSDGFDSAVKSEARKELPMLRTHLRLSRAAYNAS
ncbi:MAG: putative rane protein [Solirubrobacteraceae bacterium]|jgi:putative membrane protein|nr:putative rane protein [Solirubrobacteraceae bacterium]